MAVSFIVIILGIVIVGAIVIGIALVAFGLLSGGSKAMPEPRDVEEPADRKEILEKLARKEITKEEAEAALNSPAHDEQVPPPPQTQFNPACIIGILAAVIIGILLIRGILLSSYFVKTEVVKDPQMGPPAIFEQQIMEEAKQSTIKETEMGGASVENTPDEKDTAPKPAEAIVTDAPKTTVEKDEE